MKKKAKIVMGALAVMAGMFFPGFGAKAEVVYDYDVTKAEITVNPSDKLSDSKGIKSVLEKAKGAQSMVTIYFPAGTYYIDEAMRVYSNTHIILDDEAVIYRTKAGINTSMLHNVDQQGKMNVVGGYEMSHDIIIEGGTWDGGDTSKATDASDVIRMDHAKNITIRNCTIKNVYDCHLVELIGVQNGTISGCTFTGFRYRKGKQNNYTYAREAVQIESAWTNNESNLSDSKSWWANGSVVDGTSCQQIVVTNNTLIDMPCGIGQHHYSPKGKARNKDVEISNNTFKLSAGMKYSKTAITCCGIDNLTVTGNIVKGPYRFGSHVIASTGVVINDNRYTNISMNAIMLDKGEITSVSGNTIQNSGKHGISVGGGTTKVITGNQIAKVKHNGICVDDGKVTDITENVITDAGKHGISVAGSTSGNKGGKIQNLSRNTITKTKHNGISMDKGTVLNMNENVIKNVGKHGISVVGGTVGKGSNKNVGIWNNTITTCKQNGITVSGKGKVSSVGGNRISGVKNNGISLTEKAQVKWVVKNTIKKCKKHGFWNGTKTKTKLKSNKGMTK